MEFQSQINTFEDNLIDKNLRLIRNESKTNTFKNESDEETDSQEDCFVFSKKNKIKCSNAEFGCDGKGNTRYPKAVEHRRYS